MNRRDFIVGVSSVAAAGAVGLSPLAALAQQKAMPVVGYLTSTTEAADLKVIAATRDGLAAGGFVEGRNLKLVFRYSDGNYDRLPALVADLVAQKVDVIVASGLPATLAAKTTTATIPIVFRLAIDPVAFKLVEGMQRPGGNVTGVTTLFDPLTPKKLQLLHELVPDAALIGFLINPKNPNAESHKEKATATAAALGLRLNVLTASTAADIEPTFAAGHQQGIGALLLGDDPFFATQHQALVEAAARHAVPTMYYVRDFTIAGGLVSYGPNFTEMARRSGEYAAQILRGAKPADLPVEQPTKFELVINLKTAKALGLTVPQLLLAQADEVIE